MASTYVNNLRLEEIGTGEQSGTWGDTTNTNLEIIGQAVAWGTRAIANASTDNITIADGALDADRCLGLKLTGGGQACTVTLLPNTSSKTWFMYNATAADLTFTCGSGANVVIPAGQTKVIATDGLGSGGVVHDLLTAVNLAGTTVVDDLTVSDDLTVTDDLIVGGDIDLEGSIDVNGTANLDNVDVDGSFAIQQANSNTPTLLVQAATTASDFSISGYSDASGAYYMLGANAYLNSGGNNATWDANENTAAITLNSRTANGMEFATGTGVGTTRLTINGSGSVGIGVADGDVTSDGTAARTYVGIIGTGNRGRLNLGSTAVNGADSGVISFVNGANELGNINMETNSGVQNAGKMYISSTDLLTINSAGGVVFNDNSANVDFRIESNGNDNMFLVDGSADAVVIGKSAPDTTISGGTPSFQVIGTGVAASVASTRRENNAFGAALIMSKSRNTTPDNYTIVQAGDTLGSIIFIGDDGTNLDTYGATISNVVKSGVGENDMPTELIFSTNSGTTTVAERMKVQHNSGNNVVIADGLTLTDGNLIIGGAGHGIDFGATGQGAGSPTSEILADYEEGTFTPELRDALAGTAAGKANSSGRYTRIGRIVNISFAMSVNSVSGMTGTNSLNLTGLPYSVNSDSAGGGEPHAQILSFISPLTSVDYGGSIILRPNNNTASCEIKYTSGGANTAQGAQSLQVQNLGSNPYLCGSATYEVLAGT